MKTYLSKWVYWVVILSLLTYILLSKNRFAADYLRGQISLAVVIGLVQTAIAAMLWLRIGAYDARVRLYQLDANSNFRRVDREIKAVEKRVEQTEGQQAFLEGKVSVLERLLFKEKEELSE